MKLCLRQSGEASESYHDLQHCANMRPENFEKSMWFEKRADFY